MALPISSSPPRPFRRQEPFQAVLIVLLAGMIYWPTLHGQPLWDDAAEIFRNPNVTTAGGWLAAWTHPRGLDYLPLKTDLEWLIFRLGGGAVVGFHLVNTLLHVSSAFLFWRILHRLEVRAAWFGALVFAVHPVAVESVARMAELKSTFSVLLVLLSLWSYLSWEQTRSTAGYFVSVALFAASLLSQPCAVAFPVLLVVLSFCQNRGVSHRTFLASLPYFAVALVGGLVTLYFQASRAIGALAPPLRPLADRLLASGAALAHYLWHLVAPGSLMPIYPAFPPSTLWVLGCATWPIVLGLLLYLGTRPQETARFAGLGLATVVLALAPVLGVLPLSFLRISPYSDHLSYLACLGLAGLIAGGAGLLIARVSWPSFWSRVAVVAVVPATMATHLARTYRDPVVFWSNAVALNPSSWFAQNDLGSSLLAIELAPQALPHLLLANRLRPNSAEVLANLADAQIATGDLANARESGRLAVVADSQSTLAHYQWATALARSNQLGEAQKQFQATVDLDPASAEAWYNLGVILSNRHQLPKAAEAFGRAEVLSPNRPVIHLNLGNVLAAMNEMKQAEVEFRQAAQLDPTSSAAHECLGEILAEQGRRAEAVPEYEAALRLKPGDPEIEKSLESAKR